MLVQARRVNASAVRQRTRLAYNPEFERIDHASSRHRCAFFDFWHESDLLDRTLSLPAETVMATDRFDIKGASLRVDIEVNFAGALYASSLHGARIDRVWRLDRPRIPLINGDG